MYRNDSPRTTIAEARKNTLNSTANWSTTYMPPNVDRVWSPISVNVAMSAPIVPSRPTGIVTCLRRSGRNASNTRTSRMVPVMNSSGAMAWKSMLTASATPRDEADQAVHGVVRDPEHQRGDQAQDDDEHEERCPRRPLHRRGVRKRHLLPPLRDHSVVDALDRPQEVARREDGPDPAEQHERPEQPHGKAGAGLVRAEQGQDLSPESGQARESERRDGGEGQRPAEAGHLPQHATPDVRDLARVIPVVDRADLEEQHPGDHAVGHHPEDRGVDPHRGHGRDAEHHESHVPHRRERDEALQVA